MEAHSYHPPQCGASAPSPLHPCIANANIISYIQSNQRKREWWGDSATDRDFNECFGCFYAVPMRVYGGSSEERERESRSGAQKEEEEEIIWLVPAATLIPCPVIFYARWLDRGLVGI